MHAMLGLAATHIAIYDGDVPLSIGLVHRQHAIQGIKGVLARPDTPDRMCDLEAAIAASYALAQQATYLEDGLKDVLPLYRGCQAIYGTAAMQESVQCGRLFQVRDSNWGGLTEKIAELGLDKIDPTILVAAETSLAAFSSLCRDHPVFNSFHQQLVQVVQHFRKDVQLGLASLAKMWAFLIVIPEDELGVLMDLRGPESVLLQAHLLAIVLVLDRYRIAESASRAQWVPVDISTRWIVGICKPLRAKERYKDMLRWPLKVARAALEHQGRHSCLAASVLWQLIEEKPEAFC